MLIPILILIIGFILGMAAVEIRHRTDRRRTDAYTREVENELHRVYSSRSSTSALETWRQDVRDDYHYPRRVTLRDRIRKVTGR